MSHGRPSARRARIAIALTTALATAGIGLVGTPSAGAAAPLQSQAVGRFLDGALAGNPLQQLVDLQDARATSPGTTSAQNPLNPTLLGALNIPLTGALQLPGGGVFTLGAANQVAQANADGSSYGGAGLVSNSGGVSLGGNNSAFPSSATIDLSSDVLSSLGASLPTIPIPGGSALPALGGLKITVGAVSALAQTKVGGAELPTSYNIAGLNLTLGSPALGSLLSGLAGAESSLAGVLAPVLSLLQTFGGLPSQCALSSLTSGTLPASISLDNGAVVIDPATASLTLNLQALLTTLHLDLNSLPANTDLISYIFSNLSTILTTGLEGVINGITDPLQAEFQACLGALPAPIATTINAALALVDTGRTTFENLVNSFASTLQNAAAPGLGALATALRQVIDIGINVQPNGAAGTFTSKLKATPNQATPVVAGQSLVRAVEINLIGDPLATIALANAAAGPSSAVTTSTTPTTTPSIVVAAAGGSAAIPTGVNAGSATPSGTPTLPLLLLAVGLVLAGSGGIAWKVRAVRR